MGINIIREIQKMVCLMVKAPYVIAATTFLLKFSLKWKTTKEDFTRVFSQVKGLFSFLEECVSKVNSGRECVKERE
jgi:hypothetical protein